jgi:hypothetical protein
MKELFLAVAVLVAGPVFAQSHPIGVEVTAGNADPTSQEVADRLSGKIGASSRYALVSGTSVVLLLSVDCLPSIVNGRQVGVVCNSTVDYWPLDGIPLSCSLPGYLVEGDESDAAEHLFDSFVKQTSDEKLAAATKLFKGYLNVAIRSFPNGVK